VSAAPEGHVHQAGFYESDEEFRALILPFVEDGITAGEPVILGYDERKARLLRDWLSEPSKVVFNIPSNLYATPARAIAAYRRAFEGHLAAGAGCIRIAGDVPHEGNGRRFDGWDRYESAINMVWQGFPVRSLCLYDATTVSATVLDVVERTHPRLLSPRGAPRSNARYEDPSVFVGPPVAADPLEESDPTVELTDPMPAQARLTLRQTARGNISDDIVDDLEFAVSEAVANGFLHGLPPVTVRIWAAPGRVLVHVHDTGPGPRNHLAGLVAMPAEGIGAGMGLWITHQLDIDVALLSAADGFTVRLRAGLLPN
jgi:anti-sigma regulatory factor (Ser/Thr protein kinase)